jgi:Cu(I)-responsive transcriptional regulator
VNIGQVAKASGVSAKMIRYYESIDLIDPPQRTEAGYRVYTGRDVHMLQFIGRVREFGVPMERVKLLVSLWKDRSRASREVKRLALQQVAEMRAKVAELSAMADTLQKLADRCGGTDRPDCPILEDLSRGPVHDRARKGDLLDGSRR